MKHQKFPDRLELKRSFPYGQYPEMLPNQAEAFKIIADEHGSVTLELPTGTGKTAVGYTFLKALAKKGRGPLFYITPTKALVEQVKQLHPDVAIALGRSEHQCLYYPDEDLRADEIPCLSLIDCPHRIDQETGATYEPGATPCPYYSQKFQAKQADIVVATTAFYLFTSPVFSQEWPQPAGLVIDEVHQLAKTIRNALSFEITDWHLGRAVELLEDIGAPEAKVLKKFLRTMLRIIRRKPARASTLLEEPEIHQLMDVLNEIDRGALKKRVAEAIRAGLIDPKEKREVLKKLEVISQDIPRYLRAFRFSLETKTRYPLNYVFAYYKEEREGRERVQYRLVVKAYYVAPLIAKCLLSRRTVAFSATIGNANVLGFETGIKAPFYSLPSAFSAKNTRVFMPTDTPNLAVKARSRRDPNRALRAIARACRHLSRASIRSLVIVVSEKEREKFLEMAEEERVKVVSYGNGLAAKDALRVFKDGNGQVLVGTVRQYGEGVDLPKKLAPVIFFLRPAYPPPNDTTTVFEERRFGAKRWELWNWRVMIEALQARGRNVRSPTDKGVTFFVSQQFRRFLFGSLPEWLQPAYQGKLTLEEGVKDTIKLLAPKKRQKKKVAV